MLEELGQPLLGTTLILPGEEDPLTDPDEIRERLERQIELVIDGGACSLEPTTVIDLTGDEPTDAPRAAATSATADFSELCTILRHLHGRRHATARLSGAFAIARRSQRPL